MKRVLAFGAVVSSTVHAFGGSTVSGTAGPKGKIKPLCQPAPALPQQECVLAAEQSPANVTEGYVGKRVPLGALYQDFSGMCQVNVHFHLGAEHLSIGQYDMDGRNFMDNVWEAPPVKKSSARGLLGRGGSDDELRPGFMCNIYDKEDAKFTTPYEFKHCENVFVGLTYEVHWPHSSAGLCGWYGDGLGGVFCTQETPDKIGVQGQVFVIVNDDSYDIPNLVDGMVKDETTEISKYTGSTTGTKHNNVMCSPYAPISWHVDRNCHMVSARSFDEMCRSMKEEHGMASDIAPHGSRELVAPEFVTSIPMHGHGDRR